MDRSVDSDMDFMHFLNFIWFFFLENFPIAFKKSPDIRRCCFYASSKALDSLLLRATKANLFFDVFMHPRKSV